VVGLVPEGVTETVTIVGDELCERCVAHKI
jgi:hypothetical protein